MGSKKFPFPTGARPDKVDERDLAYSQAHLAAAAIVLPDKVDNRAMFGPVRDQGPDGTCVGMAVAGAVSGLFQEMLSARWVYEIAQEKYDEWPGDEYTGTSVRAGLKVGLHEGIPPEAFWPYHPDIEGVPLPGAAEAALPFKIGRYERLKSEQQLRYAIYKLKFAVICVEVHSGWRKLDGKARIRYGPTYKKRGAHACVLVGYDDPAEYWLLRNSWGEAWGDLGHGWVSYKDMKKSGYDFWAVMAPAG